MWKQESETITESKKQLHIKNKDMVNKTAHKKLQDLWYEPPQNWELYQCSDKVRYCPFEKNVNIEVIKTQKVQTLF